MEAPGGRCHALSNHRHRHEDTAFGEFIPQLERHSRLRAAADDELIIVNISSEQSSDTVWNQEIASFQSVVVVFIVVVAVGAVVVVVVVVVVPVIDGKSGGSGAFL